jgi:hypothetical protein
MRIQTRFFILMMLFYSFTHLQADQYTPFKPSGSEPFGTYHALIIGINKYKNRSAELGSQENSDGSLFCNGVFPDLKESVRAAQEIKSILVGIYRFEANNIKMLTGEEGTETPTRNNIMKYFAEFVTRLKDTDSLLVFFSGHGCFEPRLGVGYWIASDGLKISGEEIRSIYKSPAKHVFIVSDSCHSAQIFPDVTSWHTEFLWSDTEPNLEGILQKEKLKSRQVLASGEKDVPAGSNGNISPFCQAFIDSLKENPDRMIDAKSIMNMVKQKLALHREGDDQPEPVGGTVSRDEDRGGQFVFRRKYLKREEEIAQAYDGIHENYKQLKINPDALKELKRLTDVAHQANSPVIEYYRGKSKELLETIESIGYLKKEYAEKMVGIGELNTAKQMETLDSLLAFVDSISDINIKQNDEIKEIIKKINDDKEMLLTYARAYKKWDYKSFIEKYENKSPSRLSDALVKKAHEALKPMKMGHWFLGLKTTFTKTAMDISYMYNEYVTLFSLSFGYFIEGEKIKIIPFIEIGNSLFSFVEDEFGTAKEFTLSARFNPLLTMSAGIDIPIKWSENMFLFFTAGHTFHFLKPDSFWEKNIGPLKFHKFNKKIGLSTIDIGLGINGPMSARQAKRKKQSIWDRITIVIFFNWSMPIKSRIEYRIEIDEKYWVLVPYRLEKSFFRMEYSFRFWLGKRR